MSSSSPSTDKKSSSPTSKKHNYLERKYGKEPKITKEELDKIRWSWH